MYDYVAYGLIFRSQIPLPELVEASAPILASTPGPQGGAVVHIRLGAIDPTRPPGYAADSPAWATADSAFLEYPGAATFHIRDGREIIIDSQPDIDPRVLRLFLLGPALGLLLHQRRFLVLHASAVAVGGQAVAFVGDKGMGKSTMAAALHSRGHPLVADDLVAIDVAAAEPIAYPGFPQLKLFPESAALLFREPRDLEKVHPNFDKRAGRARGGFPTEPIPLRRVYVLVDAEHDTIEPMAPRPGFMELVRHSYLLGFLRATRAEATHFRQAISLAARVPVARLLRRRNIAALADAAQLVEDDVALTA